jgi:hypothetical protein
MSIPTKGCQKVLATCCLSSRQPLRAVTKFESSFEPSILLPSTMLQTGVPLFQAAVSVRFVPTLKLVCYRNFQSQELRKHSWVGLLTRLQRSGISTAEVWST